MRSEANTHPRAGDMERQRRDPGTDWEAYTTVMNCRVQHSLRRQRGREEEQGAGPQAGESHSSERLATVSTHTGEAGHRVHTHGNGVHTHGRDLPMESTLRRQGSDALRERQRFPERIKQQDTTLFSVRTTI